MTAAARIKLALTPYPAMRRPLRKANRVKVAASVAALAKARKVVFGVAQQKVVHGVALVGAMAIVTVRAMATVVHNLRVDLRSAAKVAKSAAHPTKVSVTKAVKGALAKASIAMRRAVLPRKAHRAVLVMTAVVTVATEAISAAKASPSVAGKIAIALQAVMNGSSP